METNKLEYWKKIVLLLCLGWVVVWMCRTMLTPIYDEIQVTIGSYSNLKMGMIASVYFFGYVVTQIPSGILMDRVGKKAVLVPGFCLFIIGTLMIGMAMNLNMIFAGSLLSGIGSGTYYSGAFSLSGDQVPPRFKYFATAIINNGCAIGVIMGYLSGGVLVKRAGVHWKVTVFAAAAMIIIVTVFFVLGLKNDRPEKSGNTKLAVRRKTDFRAFFKMRMLFTYFFYFSACYGYYMIVTWLPSFLETERGMEGSMASIYACIVALASIPGALFLGKVLDRFGKKRVVIMLLLQCIAAVMLFLIAKVTVPVLLMLCLAFYGLFGKQAIDPLIVPHISEEIPREAKTTGLGIFNFFGMSGSILAPSITGYAEDLLGSKVFGFYLAVALMVVSALLFYVANKRAVEQE